MAVLGGISIILRKALSAYYTKSPLLHMGQHIYTNVDFSESGEVQIDFMGIPQNRLFRFVVTMGTSNLHL